MRIEYDEKLDFRDVLIRPKRSVLKSRSEVSLEREFKFRHSKVTWSGVPIIAANMDHTGTFEMAKALAEHNLLTALDKFIPIDKWKTFIKDEPVALSHCFVSVGIGDTDFARLDDIMKITNIPYICLDVANGYTERFVSCLEHLREKYPDTVIMAGNVVTGEMVEELVLSGADIVKIGIGPGSVCTTREKTGVGYPQLSAIIECADAAHGLGGQVCADGGCVTPGDVAKAFAAGADFVMLGGMFAGHDECLGEVIEMNGRKMKRFYGMSSAEAMERHHGTVADYRASEGRSVNVPYRGPVKNTVLDILGGIRSTCTYVGAHRLKELSKRTTFIRVARQLNEVFVPYDVDKK
ncbi:GMP reductase [Aquicella lusitana]|uniref:GMP reductase n=1 Tax=Aquicella lusitana TaxID=254246 RepID=A0A370G3D0_9COXI|nr:GMP reductase [Aquicella lusitana]RDI38377.1 GMP reductase [Aquicella lusitana]VVC72390.1 GMP reductase [Aquicella lusitana]